MIDRVLVLTGGELGGTLAGDVPPHSRVVAADSGLHHARRLGLTVDVAVGDFDSATSEDIAWAESTGARIESHPSDKDATDLDLALDLALGFEPECITVMGGAGGRLDHLLGNILLLTQAKFAAVNIEARLGPARVTVVREHTTITGEIGDYVSLFTFGAGAHGVSSEGLLYPLANDDLITGSSRTISNELAAETASVRLSSGVLLVVQPGH